MTWTHDYVHTALTGLADEMTPRSVQWFPRVHRTTHDLLHHLTHGVAGEAGEVVDEIKKYFRDEGVGGGPDAERIITARQELADLLIYVSLLGRLLDIDWGKELTDAVARCEARWGVVNGPVPE